MEKEKYLEIYDEIMGSYTLGAVGSESVGVVISKLASIFCNYNLDRADKAKKYKKALNILSDERDDNNKVITSSRAVIMAEATGEYADFKEAEAHCDNIVQLINALKKLQEGIMEEHSYSNL